MAKTSSPVTKIAKRRVKTAKSRKSRTLHYAGVQARKRRRTSLRYLTLVQEFPLRPLRDDQELAEASSIIDSLLDRKKLFIAEKDYLHVLGNLVKEYEDECHEIPPLPDHELLRNLIKSNDLKQVELARATGIVDTTISAVLAGKRTLTREQIGTLSKYFSVPVETFSFGAATK